jgi:L-cysteine S-thiosulfotransferase
VTVKMRRAGAPAILTASLLLAVHSVAGAAEQRKSIQPADKDNPLRELISGYHFNPLSLRSLQDDDFDNPGFVWSTQGEKLWSTVEGPQKKACASCHNVANESMRGKAGSYPKYYEPAKKVVNLEQRINICREEQMKVAPWPYESDALLAMTSFVRLQSRRAPTRVRVDGPAAQTFALGKRLYTARTGVYGMSCALCHNDRYGSNLRGETISQGHPNASPAWQTRSKKLLSLHERFKSCFGLMRAEPYASGSPEFVALELYLNWRANGLPLEAPAVRR